MKLRKIVPMLALVMGAAATPAAAQDIVAVASGNGNFKTLVAAVQAAELVRTLQGPGPFTVFAPTDAAFAKLPEGAVAGLLQNREALTGVLTYHVVAGRLTAADVVGRTSLTTVNGATLPVRVQDGKVYVGNSQVVATDVNASNGVIHVIDTVLMPPARQGQGHSH